MVKLISYWMIFCAGLFPLNFENPVKNDNQCTLSIEFSDVRNKEGKLYIFIYNYENQYPDNPFKYFEVDKSNVHCNHLLVNIPNLQKGRYAISILDDENDNEDMDFFLGLPTEGYAFSNNVRPLLSLPEYNDLLFDLSEKHQKVKLKMRYVL